MPRPTRLFDLFGDFTGDWPLSVVQYFAGLHAPGSTTPDPGSWLRSLNQGVRLVDVHAGVSGDRATVEAAALLDLGQTGYLGGFPFVIASMPDVEFRIQEVISPAAAVRVYVSAADDGTEVLLEGLPVEIRLPVGLVSPYPSGERATGDFQPGRHDDLRIVYRDMDVTSVFVHVRLHVTAAGETTVRTAVPVGFSDCEFLGLACLNVHDFQLLPSPSLAPTPGPDLEPLEPDGAEWLRHGIRPWIPGVAGPYDGCFGARSVELDPARPPLADALRALSGRAGHADAPYTSGPSGLTLPPAEPVSQAELVLEDVVLPFFGIPLPRHVTIGLRRRTVAASDPVAETSFETAPILVGINAAPLVGVMVESLFYRSITPTSADAGLTVSVAFLLSGEGAAKHAVGLTVEDGWTLLATYRRDTDPETGRPVTRPERDAVDALLHHEIGGNIVDVMAVRVGYALGRAISERRSFGECFELTADLLVYLPATNPGPAGLRSLDGQAVQFLAERIGWRDGTISAGGFSLPDGVVGHLGPFFVYVKEIGLVAEDGASYFSVSGGLGFACPPGTAGGAGVERLRLRVAGSTAAPLVKLGGAFIFLRAGSFALEVGGWYVDEYIGPLHRSEYALTGSVQVPLFDGIQRFGVDVLWGSITGPDTDLRYWLIQLFFQGSIPISVVELRGARLLFANDMQPKLVDPGPGELRYYNWYKRTDPVTVKGDQRIAAWRPRANSWALGMGAGISFANAGKVIELGAFVLVVMGPDERGVLVTGEVRLLSSSEAVGYFALELDLARHRYSLLSGVRLRISTFLESSPAWLDGILAIEGTVFLSNDPATLAIGRLADERSWLSARLDLDVSFLAQAHFLVGLCLELVEGPDGVNGFGFVLRAEVDIDAGIIRASAFVGLGLSYAVFTTGSVDHLFRAWAEAGLRIVLFRFLRFGITARVQYRHVGACPSRDELQGEVRLETPWFLPDVTWHWEHTSGTLEVAALASAASPLRSAAARLDSSDEVLPVVVVRADASWDGQGPSRPMSVRTLREPGPAEAERLTLLSGPDAPAPVPVDATIELEWSVAVNDRLGLSTRIASGRGDQRTGDLRLAYDLVEVRIRRRPRYGPDRAFRPLDTVTELGVEFTERGPEIKGSYEATALAMLWDLDVRADGAPTTKKLRLNAATPFGFTVSNPETDEQTLEASPAWPCCAGPARGEPAPGHQLSFRAERVGEDLRLPRFFAGTQSTVRFLSPARTATGSQGHTAGVLSAGSFLPAFRVDLDEDAAAVVLAYGCSGSTFVHLVDADGELIEVRDFPASSSVQQVRLVARRPIRRVDVWVAPPAFLPAQLSAWLELDVIAYLPVADWRDREEKRLACARPGRITGYEGRGKLAFLPNFEYEIAVTTRVSVTHPTVPAERADVVEYVYFRTKGLPGLNATERTGAELDPYVHHLYRGGSGTLYREEPVAAVFTEGFQVAVPLTLRPGGSAEENLTVQRMHLVARSDTAAANATPFDTTSADWIALHRQQPSELVTAWVGTKTQPITTGAKLTSEDPKRARLAALTQRPDAAGCAPADARQTIGTVLLATPTTGLWPAGSRCSATVRLQDAPFVDRRPFAPGDETAFEALLDSGPGGRWTTDDSGLGPSAPGGRAYAVFGEPGWDHMTVQVTIAHEGTAAGIGLSLSASSTAARGLFALVEGERLVLRRRSPGELDVTVGQADLTTSAPWLLEVTAFDDRVRASVGDVRIEADRDEFREGRLCLVADGTARFTSLLVTGLDLYTFPFTTSRYTSFAEHIRSFRGALPALGPEAMGPGTTTSTVATLSAEPAPGGDPAARQRTFDRWISALGMPVEQDVSSLRLIRYVEDGATALLLLQTPEPLDFTSETQLQLTPRTTATPVPCTVLQDGPGLAALIVPANPLPAGAYALSFTLARRRWEAAEAADGLDHYTASATLDLAW
ncbi:hypothetical protein SMD20_09070 [Nonomuraea sp. LP-02]|uniref:hypothetical protein n=1 Tax=Nonomuraea sp. LP-02 TaxID=3097960 RepID=UPI002E32DBFD|nr:hypothetical protein [Nonomuraea sp. LP-02]MED7924381.1 hypothetical protein [Nonomuraea sp. LP-02]